MIYKFKSKASGDVIMLGATGDRVLTLLARTPAPQGIFLPEAMPAAVALLHEAVLRDDELRASRQNPAAGEPDEAASPTRLDAISLRQRAWPLLEMMQRCHAAGEPIVWGV